MPVFRFVPFRSGRPACDAVALIGAGAGLALALLSLLALPLAAVMGAR